MSGCERSRRTGQVLIHRPSAQGTAVSLTLGVLVLLTVAGFSYLSPSADVTMSEAFGNLGGDLAKFLFQPAIRHAEIADIPFQILETLGMAFLTTLIGSAVAFFLALAAARNIGVKRLSEPIRAFVAVIRAVPTVLWVLIFAIGAGLGSVAAVVGMSFHSVGYLLKAYSETFEEVDSGGIEALRASGASWWQTVFQAVFPASFSLLLSWTFVRFEINFTTTVAMGAVAGAGGIGFSLAMAAGHYFDLREVGMFTWIILGLAILFETVATRLKERNHVVS